MLVSLHARSQPLLRAEASRLGGHAAHPPPPPPPRATLTDTAPFPLVLPALDLAQLRKKFEEDRQRIELMRAQRKFRPY